MIHSRFTRKTLIAAMSVGLVGSMTFSPVSAFAEEDDRPVEANVNDAEHYTLGYPTYRMANPGDTIDISITETSHTDDLPDGVKFTLDESKYQDGIPEGMSIDESTGDVSFNVPEDFWSPEFAYIKVEFPDGSDRDFDVTIYPRDGEDDASDDSGSDQIDDQENQSDDANEIDEIQDDSNQIDEIQSDDNQDDNSDEQDDQEQDQNQDDAEDNSESIDGDDQDEVQEDSVDDKAGEKNGSQGGGYQSQRQVQFNVPAQQSNSDGVKYTLVYPNGEKYSFSSAEEAKEFAANKKGKKSQSQKKVIAPQKTFNINGYKVSVYKASDFKK